MAIRRFDNVPMPQGPARSAVAMAMVNPLEDTLSAIEKFGQRGAVMDAEQTATNDVLSGGNPGMSLGLTPAGQAYNEAARKAYETRTSLDLRAKHAELSAKFTGQNPGDAEAYAQTMGAYVSAIGAAVPDSVKPKVMAEANLRYAEGLAAVTEATNKHQYKLHVSELQAGYKASVDDAAGFAMAGRADLADAALLQALDRADGLTAAGAWSAGEAEIYKREARGSVAAGTLYQGFLAGHVTIDAVEKGEVGADLPGHIRESLVRSMEAEQAHRRSEQNAAIAQQSKLFAQGDRDLDAMKARFKLGIQPTPDELARLNAYSTGAALASPLKIEEARAEFKGLGIAREVATATPEQIATARAAFAQQPPQTTEQALVREKYATAFEARQKALADDPAAYAMTVLPDKFPPVVLPTDPASPDFDAALRQLSDNADGIRAQFGVEASPLTKEQGQRVASMLAMMPAEQRAIVRGKIQANMGANAATVWESLSKNGATVAAHAGILSMQGRPDIASSIEQGQQALDLKTVAVPTPTVAAPYFFGSGIPDAYSYDPKAQAQLRDAATARAAYLAVMAGKPGDMASYLEQAFKDVAGVTAPYNGSKIALPLGVEDVGDFKERLESVTPEAATSLGWPAGVAEALASGNARLTSAGEGRYFVTVGTAKVLNPDGSPFELNYAAIPAPPVAVSGGFLSGEPLIRAAVR